MALPFFPQPKPVPRLAEKTASSRAAQLTWKNCCRTVDARDGHWCRCCRRRTVRTLTVCRERLEHHHLVGRRIAPELAMDARAVIAVCLDCHGKLTRHELVVTATSVFESAGRVWPDARGLLHFTARANALPATTRY